MSWKVSRFRTGDLVQIKTREQILATLDDKGCIDGMPFMPEMLQYCGKVIRVASVAHKTCETAMRTWKGRRLDSTVHLSGARCTGAAHGGCQAACNLFWKDEWLSPVEDGAETPTSTDGLTTTDRAMQALMPHTQLAPMADGTVRYACQATQLYGATRPLAWYNPFQYVLDYVTGNRSLREVFTYLWLAMFKHAHRRTPIGYRFLQAVRLFMNRTLTGRGIMDVEGRIPAGEPTPAARLGLEPGERVLIKSKEAIEATLGDLNRNRGLSFDQEMAPYCGQLATVEASVTQIIDEQTGVMRHMKQPCIILKGIACGGLYSECRLLCPRAIPSYWREIWLERAPQPVAAPVGAMPNRHAATLSSAAV